MRIPGLAYSRAGAAPSPNNIETPNTAAAAPFDHDANTSSEPEETASSEGTSVVFTEATDLTPPASRCITPTPSASETETLILTPASTTRSNTPTPAEEEQRPVSNSFYFSNGNMTMSSNWSRSVDDGSRLGQRNTSYTTYVNPAAWASASSTSPPSTSFRWTTPKATHYMTNISCRRFTDTTLSRLNLPNGAIITDCTLSNCNGRRLKVKDCTFSSCNFSNSTITDCKFSSSNLRDCRLSDCHFSGSNVRGGSLSDCSHSGSVLG